MTCRKRKCNINPTLRVPGNVPYFGGGLVRTGIPFISDLIFDFDTRTDLNLVDNIAGELGAIGDFVCGDFVPASLANINCGDLAAYTFGDGLTNTAFWGSAWVYMRDASSFRIFGKMDGNPNDEWLFGCTPADVLTFACADLDITAARIGRVTAAVTGLENAWHHLMFTYDGLGASAGMEIYIDGVASSIGNIDVLPYTAMHDTTANLYIGLYNGAAQYADGLICDARIGSGVPTPAQITSIIAGGFIGTEIFIRPDVYSAIDVSGNDYHATNSNVIKGYDDRQTYLFNYGFQQYWDVATGLVSLQVPYHIDGTPTAPGTPYVHDGVNYALSENHPYNAYHNLAECFIDFNPTNDAAAKFNIFNRSLGAVFNANARVALPVGYYNAAEPWTFHISELSQYELAGYYVVGQRRKTYTQGTTQSILQAARLNLDRIFVYGTDKINGNDIAVLDFTNDIVQVVTDGAGNYIFDANGYAVLINT